MANKEGMLILFSGPSGVGKDTVLDVVLNKDKTLQKSVSLTTRNRREIEVDGKDYYFISIPKFEHMINNGEVLEFARYGRNLYSHGTTRFLKIKKQKNREGSLLPHFSESEEN